MTTPATIVLGDWPDDLHTVGNAACQVGWCHGFTYPKPCKRTEDCTGLVHAAFGDEDSDCNYWLYTKCDVCGQSD